MSVEKYLLTLIREYAVDHEIEGTDDDIAAVIRNDPEAMLAIRREIERDRCRKSRGITYTQVRYNAGNDRDEAAPDSISGS